MSYTLSWPRPFFTLKNGSFVKCRNGYMWKRSWCRADFFLDRDEDCVVPDILDGQAIPEFCSYPPPRILNGWVFPLRLVRARRWAGTTVPSNLDKPVFEQT